MSNRHIQIKASSSEITPWIRPSDWINISSVGDNEINLLVKPSHSIGFAVTIASGTFSIDWGDGETLTGCTSDTIYSHTHSVNGTPCSLGYNTWKIKIFNSTSNITKFSIKRNWSSSRTQYNGLLEAVFGTRYITTFAYAFSGGSAEYYCTSLRAVTFPSLASCSSMAGALGSCSSLESVTLPSSWGAVNNLNSFLMNCTSLKSITLPESWGIVTDLTSFFKGCSALTDVTLPQTWGQVGVVYNFFNGCSSLTNQSIPGTWGSITNVESFFAGCFAIRKINLPVSWGGVQNVNSMLNGMKALTEITLPSSWSSVNTATYFLYDCHSIQEVTIPASWGSITTIAGFFGNCKSLLAITLPSSWLNVITTTSAFSSCFSLRSVTLPSSPGSVNNTTQMFTSCHTLKEIINLDALGSTSSACNMDSVIKSTDSLEGAIVLNARLSKLGAQSNSGFLNPMTSLRLLNATSTFTGTSPQIDVSYSNLNAAALDQLFTDLPTVTGKTITITGCPGAATCTRSIATAKGWSVTG